MHSFMFHLGDYYAHTAHLSPLEDLAYRRLIDHYYLHQKPLVGSPSQLARSIRMREYVDEVTQVLREFFQESIEGDTDLTSVWRSKRCDAEIDRYQKMAEGGKKGATKRWGSDSPPMPPLSPPYPPPNANHKPITNNQEPVEKKKRAVAPDRPLEVTEPTWQSWLEIRKQKRAPVTEAVIDIMRREAKAANVSLEEAMRECCLRGWAGYKAAWKEKTSKKDEAERFWSRLDSQSTIDMELSNGNALLPQDPVPF